MAKWRWEVARLELATPSGTVEAAGTSGKRYQKSNHASFEKDWDASGHDNFLSGARMRIDLSPHLGPLTKPRRCRPAPTLNTVPPRLPATSRGRRRAGRLSVGGEPGPRMAIIWLSVRARGRPRRRAARRNSLSWLGFDGGPGQNRTADTLIFSHSRTLSMIIRERPIPSA